MHQIAILSPKGGIGRTTITANLGRLLAERSRVLLVDCDPKNALGLLFGMTVGEPAGLSTPELQHQALAATLRSIKADVPFIPFGHPPLASLAAVETQARLDATWLEKRLKELAPQGFDHAVLDTTAARGVWQSQALGLATVIIVVLEACALSYATLPEVDALVAEAAKRPGFKGVIYVLNRVDGRRALSRDVRSAMSQAAGADYLDIALVDDEHVREASALRTTCVQHAPHSQFSAAMRMLAARVLELTR